MVEKYLLWVVYFYVFWTMFLACAALYAQWHVLPVAVKMLAAPIALVAGLFDVVSEFTLATIFFGQLPMKGCYTVTERLSFYMYHDMGWRGKLSKAVCTYLLNPFQAGGHCHQ